MIKSIPQAQRWAVFFSFLYAILFVFSSVHHLPQVFSFVFLIALFVAWFMLRPIQKIPLSVKYIIYAYLAILITNIPNLFFNGGFAYDRFRSFNLPLVYVVGAIILALFVGLRITFKPKVIFYIIGLSTWVNGAIALYQRFVLNYDRVGTSAGIFEFANLSSISGLCALVYFFRKDLSPKEIIFFALGFILTVIMLAFNGSRGIMLGFGVACVVIAGMLLLWDKQAPVFKRGLPLLLVCLISVAFLPGAKDLVKKRVVQAESDIQKYQENYYQTSIGLRFKMWQEAWEAFKLSPIIGLNPKSFCEYVKCKGQKEYGRAACYQRLHSEILNTLARKGILGLLALLAVWVSVANVFLKKVRFGNDDEKLAGICIWAVLALLIVGGIGDEPFSNYMESTYFTLLVPLFWGLVNKDSSKENLCAWKA